MVPNEIAIRLRESYLGEVSTFEQRYLVMNHAEVHCDCVLTDTGKKYFLRDGNLLPVSAQTWPQLLAELDNVNRDTSFVLKSSLSKHSKQIISNETMSCIFKIRLSLRSFVLLLQYAPVPEGLLIPMRGKEEACCRRAAAAAPVRSAAAAAAGSQCHFGFARASNQRAFRG